MKSTIKILLLLIGLSSSRGYAQTYHKFIDTNKYWDVTTFYWPNICGILRIDRLFFDRDTTINNLDYSILCAYPVVNINPGPLCPPVAINSAIKYDRAIMREDTINKQVFLYTVPNGDELLFDFDLTVGDTLANYPGFSPQQYIVDSISTVVLADGSTRNIFYTTGNVWQVEYFIEGMGGSRGPQYTMEIAIDGENSVTCYSENGLPLWGNSNWLPPIDCHGFLGVEDLEQEVKVKIYPNPASNYLIVDMEVPFRGSLNIYDQIGRFVLTFDCKEKHNILPLQKLLPGIYQYQYAAISNYSMKGSFIVVPQ